MTDITYSIGVKKIIDHFIVDQLENDTNCMYAVLGLASYGSVQDEDEADMATFSLHDWDDGGAGGAAANGGQSTASKLVIPIGNVSTAIDGDGKVAIKISTDLLFGNVTAAGDPVKYVMIYVKDDGGTTDAERWPLVCFELTTAVQPVVDSDLTFAIDTDGIVLWDPNP